MVWSFQYLEDRQRGWKDFWTDSKSVIIISLEYRYQLHVHGTESYQQHLPEKHRGGW